jgi:hypothetical protein
MTDRALAQKIAELFQETGHAHHQAFIQTDGADPEWPLWYADYMREKLEALLNTQITRSELAHILATLDKKSNLRAPGEAWPVYYARSIVERYLRG